MTADVPELTAHLGYWLRQVSNHVSHAFARKLEAEGVTVAEWTMLRELYGGHALGPSRLAERMGLTRGAILYYYADLEALLAEAQPSDALEIRG